MDPNLAQARIERARKKAQIALMTTLANLVGTPEVAVEFQKALAAAPSKTPDYDVALFEAQAVAFGALAAAVTEQK